MMKARKIEIPETDEITLPEAEKRLSKLEAARVCDSKEQGFSNYEITRAEIHELVQAKAFRLGWEWSESKQVVSNTNAIYLFLYSGGRIFWNDDKNSFDENGKLRSITWQDFLELPEPSKSALPPCDEKLAEQARDFAYEKEMKDEKKNCALCALCAENTATKTGLCLGCGRRHKEALELIELGAKTKAANKITKEDCLRILELFQPEFEQLIIFGKKGLPPEFVEKCKLYDNAVKQLNKYFEASE